MTGDAEITNSSGQRLTHGQLSWAFGQALLNLESGARWSEILHEMVTLIQRQVLSLDLMFHGQFTRCFVDR